MEPSWRPVRLGFAIEVLNNVKATRRIFEKTMVIIAD